MFNKNKNKRSIFLLVATLLLATLASTVGAVDRHLFQQSSPLDQHRHSRALSNNNNNNADTSFLSGYAAKFQGCHFIQQWNENAASDSEVRIKTKRLVRYRLCPKDTCNSDSTGGCTSKYGDYVVDLDTFVASYVSAMKTEEATLCQDASDECACNNDADCLYACYQAAGLSMCQDAQDVSEYTTCAQMNNNAAYYVGPYCADQGGEILLGVFTDDTCTAFAQYGADVYYTATGSELPYSNTSLIATRCVSCAYNSAASSDCATIYSLSGKCETKLEGVDYPNEASCGYIDGVKIVRANGVIRTSTVKKSRAAAVSIGVFLTAAVLLAGYAYYLRTKLSRAQINLMAAAHPLT
jgi:hypothetical protein